jgi:hypothetical protein
VYWVQGSAVADGLLDGKSIWLLEAVVRTEIGGISTISGWVVATVTNSGGTLGSAASKRLTKARNFL